MEFVTRFNNPALTTETLVEEFPEIVNPDVKFDEAKDMYQRFAKEATTVLATYPNLMVLMQ